jgi:uncharacterized protein (TIGR02246 family)
MTPEHRHEFATRYTEAWCSFDPRAPASFFAPDGSLTVNGGTPAVGRDAIAEVVRGFYDAFPDTVLVMDAVRGAGNRAIYLWTYIGTNSGPGGTGKKVRFSGWEAWTFSDDDLITTSIGTFDADEYARQLEEGV